ncbi:dTDP-4-dehydrorhamnose reductase [Pediococcus pentosaceus]|uniref:dTDP-4-dehydrorhamnose reductase n=1 Tax=Pediococcus pentosaceus TaxID=1255 RepID=UPI0021AE8A2A|nr:dTDP-4-dehydrorhamnose reductase [Pediococcus pentosaceus]MCS8574750.1 dTDP-4-dehydrorhamnose reductase [Pediococcus pentosaceus]MDN4853484.1 dTDP-4-dehydrorhamnose reductase [Pediococcus pentosaceus]
MDNLIIGANGQLGTELRKLFDEKKLTYTATDSGELDITNKKAVYDFLKRNKPRYIYHCAAFTAVDAAEEEPGKSLNWNVNVNGTENVAEAAESINATLVFVSTDYVFNGQNSNMYSEHDQPDPKNEYGKAKFEGEQIVSKIMSKYYILRTSWVFGKYGKNFVYTMLNLAKTHDKLTVVSDQIGRPTWTRTLAEFMFYAVDKDLPFGLYQTSNNGQCSWYEFASEILKNTSTKVFPISSDDYPQKAYRPKHSVMSLEKMNNTGFKNINWKQALNKFLKDMEN